MTSGRVASNIRSSRCFVACSTGRSTPRATRSMGSIERTRPESGESRRFNGAADRTSAAVRAACYRGLLSRGAVSAARSSVAEFPRSDASLSACRARRRSPRSLFRSRAAKSISAANRHSRVARAKATRDRYIRPARVRHVHLCPDARTRVSPSDRRTHRRPAERPFRFPDRGRPAVFTRSPSGKFWSVRTFVAVIPYPSMFTKSLHPAIKWSTDAS